MLHDAPRSALPSVLTGNFLLTIWNRGPDQGRRKLFTSNCAGDTL
jgi:hypothetical protein